MLLGFVHLIEIGLEFAHCSHGEFIFFPVLQFAFVFLVMHFTFSQSRRGARLGYSNVALSHLLVTQTTLWLLHFDRNYGSCGYAGQPLLPASSAAAVAAATFNQTATEAALISRQRHDWLEASSSPLVSSEETQLVAPATASPSANLASLALPFNGILVPVMHHYQLLTITILASICLANNHAGSIVDSPLSLRTGFSSNSADSEFGYQFFKKKASIKGFFVGLLMTSGTIVVLVLKDHQLSLIAHTVLQVRLLLSFRSPLLLSSPSSHQPFPSQTTRNHHSICR